MVIRLVRTATAKGSVKKPSVIESTDETYKTRNTNRT